MARFDVYQDVTNRIVAELENGAAPWVKPWQSNDTAGMPHNPASGTIYSGTNILLLWIDAAISGYETPSYVTFNQAKKVGGTVRKGERGARICYASTFKKKIEDSNGDEVTANIPFMKAYTVFHVSQCDGLPDRWLPEPPEARPTLLIDDDFQRFVSATRAVIRHGGGRAFYVPSKDFIQMPHALDFAEHGGYQATLLHELGHWTGDDKRLDRSLTGRFGTQAYAAEELVAEMTAAFLCAHLGVKGDLRHASYIESWIKLLKSDKKAIFTAASKAQAAADYLRSFSESEVALAA